MDYKDIELTEQEMDEDIQNDYRGCSRRSLLKYHYNKGKHIPNKNEAKKLRQIMSKTGLSEEEVRSIKKYRKQLSDAQKREGIGRSRQYNYYKRILKNILQDLKLPKEHPLVKERLKEQLDKNHYVYGFISIWSIRPTVDVIISNYKRKKKKKKK